MKKLTKKWQMFFYAIGGMGVNMLNLMVNSYLCSALIASGFKEDAIANQTFLGIDLVIPAVWAVFGVIAKIIDGIIDVPMASLTDNLKTYAVNAVVHFGFMSAHLDPVTVALLNTIFYGIVLCVFYTFYTLTMVTYYATFTEIVEKQEERNYISNVKSVCDIVYFILGYVVVRMLLNGMNIRIVSMIVLPIVLTMLIPLFMIKENSTKDGVVTDEDGQKSETVNLFKSIAFTFKNKSYILWMIVYSFMTFGVQLFLSGINEYFSVSGMSMIFVMMASFAPVPFTLLLYNKLTRDRGFGFSYRYILIIFAVGMLGMFGVSMLQAGTLKTILSIVTGVISSFGIGAMFSVAYSVPAELAAEEEKKTGISNAAMYFAVQGLFAGVASGIGGQAMLTLLKTQKIVQYMTPICAAAVLLAFALTFMLPKSIQNMGRKNKELKK